MNLPSHLIVSTDFDGTLTSPDRPDILSPEFMHWLGRARQQSKVTWVINTGRSWESLQTELERRRSSLWPEWVVLAEREIHRVESRSAHSLQSWNGRCAAVHEKLFQETRRIWEAMRRDFRSFDQLQMVRDIACPLGFIAFSEEQADALETRINERISAHSDLIVVRNSIYFRFGHRDFSKGSCLREIAARENLDENSCFAAGDHCNDLSMLKRSVAASFCCPANADAKVKDQVRRENGFISGLRYSEGVVDGLKHYFG